MICLVMRSDFLAMALQRFGVDLVVELLTIGDPDDKGFIKLNDIWCPYSNYAPQWSNWSQYKASKFCLYKCRLRGSIEYLAQMDLLRQLRVNGVLQVHHAGIQHTML